MCEICDGLVRSLCLQGGDERGEKRRFIFCQYGDLYIPILIKFWVFHIQILYMIPQLYQYKYIVICITNYISIEDIVYFMNIKNVMRKDYNTICLQPVMFYTS